VRSHVRPVKGLAHIHAMSSLSVYRVLVTKTVLVTGGGRGLGRVTAEKLAVAGHRVILVARVAAAAEAAVEEIQHSHPHVRLEARSVDLSSLTQVRAFATTEAERGEPIDLLLNHSSAQRA